MSILTGIIDNPMQLSSNFVLSCEVNTLNGYSIGDPVLIWNDQSGTGNHVIRHNNLYGATYNVDAQGYPCLNSIGAAAMGNGRYLTTLSSVQPASGVTYVVVFNAAATFRFLFSRLDSFPYKKEGLLLQNQSVRTDITINSTAGSLVSSGLFSVGDKTIVAYRRNSSGFCQHFRGFKQIGAMQLTDFSFSTNNVVYNIFYDSQGGSVFSGDVYQMHICHEALSDDKLMKLIRYAAFKSGIKI